METKFFLKSKEVWVLGLAIIFAIAEAIGISPTGLVESAKDAYITISPFIALVLRVFWTSAKLRFVP